MTQTLERADLKVGLKIQHVHNPEITYEIITVGNTTVYVRSEGSRFESILPITEVICLYDEIKPPRWVNLYWDHTHDEPRVWKDGSMDWGDDKTRTYLSQDEAAENKMKPKRRELHGWEYIGPYLIPEKEK